ncbi:hypothetical protein SAMN05421833_1683 [Microbispora rosea]|uniref:Uncharacterized protein n=1 Tax=Microbispora rosea TaxID=58117 RepID=A0A1N7HKJ7_9ACTN|nr:hypothetical protein SAMN05421833_1683 [Microbispora rosea]
MKKKGPASSRVLFLTHFTDDEMATRKRNGVVNSSGPSPEGRVTGRAALESWWP